MTFPPYPQFLDGAYKVTHVYTDPGGVYGVLLEGVQDMAYLADPLRGGNIEVGDRLKIHAERDGENDLVITSCQRLKVTLPEDAITTEALLIVITAVLVAGVFAILILSAISQKVQIDKLNERVLCMESSWGRPFLNTPDYELDHEGQTLLRDKPGCG